MLTDQIDSEELNPIAQAVGDQAVSLESGQEKTENFLANYVFNPDLEVPDEEVIFDGLLCKGDLAVWVGREKHRKTNVVLQLAFAAALGKDFLHFRLGASTPLRVVYVDYESKTASLHKRYNALCQTMKLNLDEKQRLKVQMQIIEVRRMQKEGQTPPRFPIKPKSPEEREAEKWWQQFTATYPADLYIFDPLRCLHAQDENDSSIEALLARLRQVSHGASIIIPHHMTKRGNSPDTLSLKDDMRTWSDGARGSGAIKAHSDVIICQERVIEEEGERVYWGAFLKDGADIEPLPLEETDAESFFWKVSAIIPDHLTNSYKALKEAGGIFKTKKAAVEVLEKVKVKRSSAYRHLDDLRNHGWLAVIEGEWVLRT